ncbi:MAG: PAS domain S-box protein [Methanobacterium sp.]|uniref:PAS domain-containing sensor histidine kinase n=1 Tax=Methanobacterium sp. TaxID=2164 RepID=UPI003C794080
MIKKNVCLQSEERICKNMESEDIQKLQESEERYRNLFETMTLGVVYQDVKGQIISANTAAQEILGLTIDQMQGRTSTDPRWKSVHEDGSDYPGKTHPAMVALKTGKIIKNAIMGVFDPKYKQTRWIKINATPQFRKNEKKPYQVYTTFEDITKRKKSDEALNESEEKFSKAFHSNSAAMTVTRLNDGLIIDANESFETLFGYTHEETVGHNTNELGIWLDPQERDAKVEQLLKQGKLPLHEVTFGTKTGKNINVLFSVELIHIKGKTFILTTSMDITERKKVEERNQKLLESEQQLTEELKTSNEELLVTTEELQIVNEELVHQGNKLLKINKALRESEKHFHDLADNIPNLAWMADETGWIFWYNTQWYDYTGTTPEEMQGWGWQKVHHPDYVGSVTEEWTSNIKAGKAYDNTFPLKGKDGNYRWFLTRVTPIKDEQGKVLRWFGTNTNITELKRVQKRNQKLLESEQLLTEELTTSNEELQATTHELQDANEELHHNEDKLLQAYNDLKTSEESFRGIIENIQDAYMRADKEGTIIMASSSAARMYRFNLTQEMLGTSTLSYFKNSEDRDFAIEKLKKHGKYNDYEVEARRNDGTFFWVSQNAQYYYDNHGEIQGYETIVRDITQRKKIEAALKKSERSLDKAQQIAHIGSWEWNIKTGDISWSNELYSIYGVDPNSFTPTLSSFGDYMHPDDEEYVNQHVDQLLSEGKPHNFDFRIVLDDGSIRVLNTLAEVARFDKNGKPSMIVGINQDITERKDIELKLNENITKLAQSNKELEQFAYITSHDLREPLRMITSFLQLLERRYNDQLDQDANEFIGFAVDGAKRLDAMTKDLLQYSKITTEKRDIKPVDFEYVLEQALINLKVPIEKTNAVITHDPLPIINSDEHLKVQLFQNIIGNAIKYHSKETPKIHISAIKENNQYLFSIKDNGIGMSPEHLKRIFTIFQRLHTNEEYEGTGIGLSIVQKIVHQQGGQIWVESEIGKGSTFYFTIPIE